MDTSSSCQPEITLNVLQITTTKNIYMSSICKLGPNPAHWISYGTNFRQGTRRFWLIIEA